MGLGVGSFPGSESAAREVLTLPLHPQMTEAQVDRVASALERVLPG
jgi:dTDP-4-amino-4,6-dideoxygalactose transaminase